MNTHTGTFIFTLLLAGSCSVAMAEDLVVVVNKANPVSDVSSAQLKKMVLDQQTSWTWGKKVSVLLRGPGQAERDGVLRSVCGMSENEYNQFTMHADLNGQTLGEPKIVNSAAAVRQSVIGNPGAIGFLRPSELNDTVKPISVDGSSAGQPGYKIKSAN